MAEVATAFVSLVPSLKGFGAKTEQQIGPELQKSGGRVGAFFGGALKKGALGVTAAAGGVLGTALFKGFQRLQSIDQARAKLTGLGHDTRTVDKIMSNALASVKGTAFGLGDAATVSASAVAAGIKPGQQLEKTLRLVADAATIGGSSLSEMGAIFNKVAASNKIQGDVINQLNDQGIPIVQLLAKQLGITNDEVLILSKEGKIGFETFSAAMQAGLGGAALKSGETFSGALANVGASLSRIGAGLLGGIFPHLAPMFAGITEALAPLETGAAGLGEKIGSILGPALEGIGPLLSRIVTGLTSLDFSKVSAGEGALGGIGEAFKKLGAAIGTIDFGSLGSALGKGVADTISVFAVVIGFAADHVDTFAKILPALVVAFAAYKAAQVAANVVALASIPLQTAQVAAQFTLASAMRANTSAILGQTAAENIGVVTRTRSTAATLATVVATTAAAAGAKIWAAAQWLLNAALTANPIGIVVVAIVALVAGLVIAYKKSETFRNIVNKAFAAVKNVVGSVIGWFGKTIPAVFSRVVGLVKGYVNLYRSVVVGAFNLVKGAVTTAIGVFGRFATTVGTKIGDALGFIKSLPGKAKDALGNLGSTLLDAGKELIQGLIDGIAAKFKALKKKMGEVAQVVKDFLPGSPVKEGPLRSWNNGGAGKRLVDQGIIAGLDARGAALSSSMTRLASRVRVSTPSLSLDTDVSTRGYGAAGQRPIVVNDRSGDPARTAAEVARRMAWAG